MKRAKNEDKKVYIYQTYFTEGLLGLYYIAEINLEHWQ